jgi:hypothetical protein
MHVKACQPLIFSFVLISSIYKKMEEREINVPQAIIHPCKPWAFSLYQNYYQSFRRWERGK